MSSLINELLVVDCCCSCSYCSYVCSLPTRLNRCYIVRYVTDQSYELNTILKIKKCIDNDELNSQIIANFVLHAYHMK